jgi:hypothetical protein
VYLYENGSYVHMDASHMHPTFEELYPICGTLYVGMGAKRVNGNLRGFYPQQRINVAELFRRWRNGWEGKAPFP